MAVAFDAVGPSSSGTTSASSPLTWTHVCGASATHLLVGATWDGSPDGGGSMSATYNSVSMTSLGVWHCGGGTAGFLQVWALASPATGSHSVSITAGGSPLGLNAGSVSFTGSAGLSAVQSAVSSGAQTNPALTFTGSVSGNVVAAFVGGGSPQTPSGSFTSRYNENSGSGQQGAGYTAGSTIASPGGSTTASWTMNSDFWAVAAVEVQATAAGTANAGVAAASASAAQPGIDGQVTSQGTPVNAHSATGSVTGTWPTGSSQVAGRLLVAVVTAGASTSAAAISTPGGWVKQLEQGSAATALTRAAIYTKVADGGDAAPSFTSTESGTAGGMDCMLFELIGADTTTILDTSGVFGSGSSSVTLNSATFTCTTSASPHAGSYAIAVFSQERAAASLTFTDSGTGWTKLLNGNGASIRNQTAILVQANPPTSGTLNDHGQFSTNTTAFGAAIVAVFALAAPGISVNAGVAAAAGAAVTASTAHSAAAGAAAGHAVAVSVLFSPCITGLAGTGAGYFADHAGNPRMVLGDAVWGLPGNAGRWSSGDWQGDFDTYTATRAGQGFTVIYTKPMGTTQNAGINDDGRTFDGLFPFQGGSFGNPSSGLTSSYWARIDYFLASALAQGLTVFLNAIGYDSDFETSGPLSGKSASEFQSYGAAIGARYASQPNLIWMVADDYFGSSDTKIDGFLTGLRGAGANQPISIENYPETTSRFDDSASTALAWGTANADFQFTYSYNRTYYMVEKAYLESSPITVIQGDGYFYQGGSSYAGGSGAFAYDRAIRQDAWHAISSGARGIIHGDEACWQWASTAQASATNNWYQKNNAGNIRALMESLPNWHLLIPDTSSLLVTAGRGTHATGFTSGGGGGQYEVAFTDSYVSASRTAAGDLAVIYLSHATSITVDQTKMVSGYVAYWVDPVTGAKTSTTTGTTYNSSGPGNNSQGDPDWVLVLQAPGSSVTASAGVAAASAVANAPAKAVTVTAGAAAAAGAAPAPAHAATAGPAAAAAAGAAPAPVAAITASAAVAAGTAVANAATVSTSSATNAPAGVAAASAAALAAGVAVGPSAGVAAAQATALQPAAGVAPPASVAAASAVALAAKAAAGISAGPAAGTGIALAPVPAAGAIAAVAPASAIALPATVNTSGSTNAVAGVAAAAAAATSPQIAVTLAAGAAAGAATAPAPVPAAAVLPAAGAGHATGLAATVSTVSGTQAIAGVATASALALRPATAVTFTAAAARALAAALAATVPPPFTVGALTASATAPQSTLTAGTQRTGGPS